MGRKLFILLFGLTLSAKEQCSDSSIFTCNECLMRSPQCVWCADQPEVEDLKLTKQRVKCGTRSELEEQKCQIMIEKESKVEFTTSSVDSRISPKTLSVDLRYGDPIKFTINFTSPEYYPIDMYYLMDLSQSMSDDLENLRKLAQELSSKMKEITGNKEGNLRIGHGSFVDKTVLPFVSTVPEKLKNPCTAEKPCEAPYTFRSNMRLSPDTDEFDKIVKKINHSSNLDAPEAGLDAMMQAIVCDDVIGWESGRHKLLVYSSDANFHVAGDGKLGGILEPNDMQCHTSIDNSYKDGQYWTYKEANRFDYPSIGQIIDVINEKEILIIFAVTAEQVPTYQELQKLLPHATVGELSDDSKDVVEIVQQKYKELAQKVSLQYSDLPEAVSVKIVARCGGEDNQKDQEEKGFCTEVQQSQTVQFDVELVWDGTDDGTPCPQSKTANFSIFGMDAWTSINLDFICDCDCQVTQLPKLFWENEKEQKTEEFTCNTGQYTTCGQCECPPDKIGNMCECQIDSEGDKDFYSNCTDPDAPEDQKKICSGWGQCQCGKCACQKFGAERTIYGEYCQCDTDLCPKGSNGMPCGGKEHGNCRCDGTCECAPGWEDEQCSCSTDDSLCVNPAVVATDGSIQKPCSGHGDCKCGECECWELGEKLGFYSGDYCERFNSQCEKHEDCAKCIFAAYLNSTSNDLAPDCMKYCMSKDTPEIYIDGIIYDPDTKTARIDKNKMSEVIQDKVPDEIIENGKFCIGQDDSKPNSCQFRFGFREMSSFGLDDSSSRKIKLVLEKEKLCPEPPNPWVVAGSILGGVVFLGLVILTLIKIIIYIISRREVKEWEKERNKTAITCGQNPLYNPPETKHDVNRSGYASGSAYHGSSN